MNERRYTKPQRRALLALPGDGSPLTRIGRDLSQALSSLELYHPDLVIREFGDFGPRGGHCARCRLTAAGVDARREEARKNSEQEAGK